MMKLSECGADFNSPPGMNLSSLVNELMKLPGRGFMTIEFLLEDLSLGRYGEFRESLPALAVC